ncbi:MAG: TIGR02996 domain-containing protein [Myxococcota bacterium]
MADSNALLRDVLAAPEDLDRRRVYADLLIAEGDPRGTFIAQQIALRDRTPLDDDFPELHASTERLRARHEAGWVRPQLEHLRIDTSSYHRIELSPTLNARFVDGFLSRIAMGPEDLDARFDEITRTEPIQGVELLLPGPLGFGPHPVASRWRELKLTSDDWSTSFDLAQVLHWDLTSLEALDVSGLDLRTDGMSMLANEETNLGDFFEEYTPPPPLRDGQLRELRVFACALGDEGLEILARMPALRPTHLDLGQNRITSIDAVRLLCTERFDELVSLGLTGNNAIGPALGALGGWAVLGRLAHLTVPQTTTPEAFGALFPMPSEHLRELDASAGKALLAAPERVANASTCWTRLNLGTTRLEDRGVDALLAVPSTRTLVEIALNGCSLTDAAVRRLCSLERLVRIDLSSNKLTDAGLQALAEAPFLGTLASLRIGNNRKVTAAGYQALIDAPGFDPAVLDVGKIGDEGLEAALRERFGGAVVIR